MIFTSFSDSITYIRKSELSERDILKVFMLAEKYHLIFYSRLIFDRNSSYSLYASLDIEEFDSKSNFDNLSSSDIEALDFAIENFDKLDYIYSFSKDLCNLSELFKISGNSLDPLTSLMVIDGEISLEKKSLSLNLFLSQHPSVFEVKVQNYGESLLLFNFFEIKLSKHLYDSFKQIDNFSSPVTIIENIGDIYPNLSPKEKFIEVRQNYETYLTKLEEYKNKLEVSKNISNSVICSDFHIRMHDNGAVSVCFFEKTRKSDEDILKSLLESGFIKYKIKANDSEIIISFLEQSFSISVKDNKQAENIVKNLKGIPLIFVLNFLENLDSIN